MLASLATLITLQELDSATEAVRKRLVELPEAERALAAEVDAAAAVLAAIERRLADNVARRRDLEKEVAQIDTRLARFEDHKAAVKTNQEFTALLHEISVARSGKDTIEEQILVLLEEADQIGAERTAADTDVKHAQRAVEGARTEMAGERAALESEIARLTADRNARAALLDAPLLARYEQLLKQRRMVAVAPLVKDVCGACHVKQRPVIAQHVRANDQIVACDSCKRILYSPLPPPEADAAQSAPAS